tara:strand:+ start:526 stop:864 length:339 start_codon:yes stop_codon:yes gene_type:complete
MKRILTFITSANDNISFEVGKFRGVTPAGGTSATMYFDKLNGAATGVSTVVVNFKNENNGFGFKKFSQAMTAAFANQPKAGNVVIGNDSTGTSLDAGFNISGGITSIGTITE